MNIRSIRQYVIIGIIIIAALFIYFMAHRFLIFNLINTDPGGSSLPASQTHLVFTFNKDLDPKNTTVTLDPSYGFSSITTGKNVTVDLSDALDEPGMKLSVTIQTKSTTGSSLHVVKRFTAKDVNFNNLSSQQQSQAVDQSSSFENQYPLINSLPIQTSEYEINYQYPDTGETKMPITINCLAINYDDPLAEPTDPSWQAIYKKCLADAVSWLKAKGYTASNYQLYFQQPYFLNQYGAKDAADLNS